MGPSAQQIADARITDFARHVQAPRRRHDALWNWSVTDLPGFWAAIWATSVSTRPATTTRCSLIRRCPAHSGSPARRSIFAEHLLNQGSPATSRSSSPMNPDNPRRGRVSACATRRGPRGPRSSGRCRPGRRRRRISPAHRRDDRRLRSDRVTGRHLVGRRQGLRRRRRHRPLRPTRAEGAHHLHRLPLPGKARTPGRRRMAARRPADRHDDHRRRTSGFDGEGLGTTSWADAVATPAEFARVRACRSTIRCGCSSRPAPPAYRRPGPRARRNPRRDAQAVGPAHWDLRADDRVFWYTSPELDDVGRGSPHSRSGRR